MEFKVPLFAKCKYLHIKTLKNESNAKLFLFYFLNVFFVSNQFLEWTINELNKKKTISFLFLCFLIIIILTYLFINIKLMCIISMPKNIFLLLDISQKLVFG